MRSSPDGLTASNTDVATCPQAEQLSQRATEVSRLEAEVGELQSRLQQLTEEREGLLGHLHAKAAASGRPSAPWPTSRPSWRSSSGRQRPQHRLLRR